MGNGLDEYEGIADLLARRRLKGVEGDPLPDTISEAVENLIDDNLEAFENHVRALGALQTLEEQRANEIDPLVSCECEAVAGAEPRLAETNSQGIAQPKLSDLFSPKCCWIASARANCANC